MHTRRRLSVFVCSLLAAGAAVASPDEWAVVSPEGPVAGAPADVVETIWSSSRPPGGAYDRVQVHRFRVEAPAHAALLYLPGTNMNGQVAVPDERHNLWLYLARRGVQVYTLDYRTHAVPPTGIDDFSFMKSWTMEAFVEDARAAARLARRESAGLPLFVAGFSRGVGLAYALVGVEDGMAGLVALDGFFKRQGGSAGIDVAGGRLRLESTGAWASDVAAGIGWEPRHELMARVVDDPLGPPSRDGFSTIGEQLAKILYNAWRPGALANAVDGYSRPEILARLLDGYDRYYPAVQDLDGTAISGPPDDPTTALDDAWGEMRLPVFYVGCTGMGPSWVLDGLYSAVRSGSADVEIHVLEGHGHLDLLVGENSLVEVFEPLRAWIEEHSPTDVKSPSP